VRTVELLRERKDLDSLVRFASLYEAENRRLNRRIQELTTKLATLQGKDAAKQLALELLRVSEQTARLQHRLFGASSERRPGAEADKDKKSKKRHRGHGPTRQTNLQSQEEMWGLATDDCDCPRCGRSLKELGEETEDSEEITVIERRYVLKKHRRKKYRCQCNAVVITAPGPLKLIPGGRYSLDFAVHVIAAKYIDHMPMERQRRAMARDGLVVTTQTLCDYADAAAACLEGTYNALRGYILGADVIGADETWWRLMGKRSTKRWWVWAVTCADACWYTIENSRSAKTAAKFFKGYEGSVVCDGYKAYETLARTNPNFRLAHCWAHVRRKFVEAEAAYAVESQQALAMIGELFLIERAAPIPHDLEGEEYALALDARQKLHDKCATPLLARLKTWAMNQVALPRGALAKAIRYMLTRWEGLTAFLKNSEIPIHNNHTERAMRNLVLGRKNHYGSRSVRGTEVAAVLYSLVETARLCGVNPQEFLRRAIRVAIEKPGEVLLPQTMAAQLASERAEAQT
jgi:transposase